jgi:hypothetical protein
MQRIDENTYIDDTLVTCAEYQLFIDEMREQGKYYQPDHWSWTSYKFPEGQAREPILGVRFSDAKFFCEWLTQRKNLEWIFRLPSQTEAISYSMSATRQSAVGYWSINADNQSQIAWIINSSLDPPVPSQDHIRRLIKSIKVDIFGARNLRSLERSLEDVFNNAIKRARNRIYLDGIDLEHTRVLDSALDLVRDSLRKRGNYDLKFERALYSTRDRALEHPGLYDISYDDFFEFSNTAFSEISIKRERYNRILDRHLDFIHGGIYSVADLIRGLVRSMDHNRALDFTLDIDRAFDLYIDIYMLDERIAGRSPAFEGIRLVKERIR